MGTVLGGGSSCSPGKSPERAFQAPKAHWASLQRRPFCEAWLPQPKNKRVKRAMFPLLWALVSRFPGPAPGDSDSWVLGGAQESMFFTRFKRPLFWLVCHDPMSGGFNCVAQW